MGGMHRRGARRSAWASASSSRLEPQNPLERAAGVLVFPRNLPMMTAVELEKRMLQTSTNRLEFCPGTCWVGFGTLRMAVCQLTRDGGPGKTSCEVASNPDLGDTRLTLFRARRLPVPQDKLRLRALRETSSLRRRVSWTFRLQKANSMASKLKALRSWKSPTLGVIPQIGYRSHAYAK